jgi:hypothetical protein
MKYLKRFERKYFLFEVGDKVKLDTLIRDYKNRIYIILQQHFDPTDGWTRYYITSDDDDKLKFWEYEQNLKKATKKEIEDYQLKIIAKKYNI